MRIRFTLDIERHQKPEPVNECGVEYVPAAQVERAEPRRVGFQVDPAGEGW